MRLIAHRGNTKGKTNLENHPIQITAALQAGYDVEIDVWVYGDDIYFGHDAPEYKSSISFLEKFSDRIWIHCKNSTALEFFSKSKLFLNYFWHQNDDYTLTSYNYIWIYPGLPIIPGKSIVVMPETVHYQIEEISSAFGICSDHVEIYSDIFNEIG